VKKNSHHRVIFILGAGASVPLGCRRPWGCERRSAQDARGPGGDGNLPIDCYRFRIAEQDVNIEDFLEHLYELQLMLWLARRSSLPQLLSGFTGSEPIPAAADDMLKSLQRRVYQLLHETCGDCSGRTVDALWRPILKSLGHHQPFVPVFTLNYDWTFEKLAIER